MATWRLPFLIACVIAVATAQESPRLPADPSNDSLLKRFDKNGDGKIDDEERQAIREFMRQRGRQKGSMTPSGKTETIGNREVTEMEYASSDGRKIPCVLSMPKGAGLFPCVVTIHGGQGNRDLAYIRTLAAPNPVSPTVSTLNEQPWAILAISYRAGEGLMSEGEQADVIPMYITLLAGGQGGVTAVHAKTGQVLWQYNRIDMGAYPIVSPVVRGDLVAVSTFGGWAVLKMAASGKDAVTVTELKRHEGKELGNYWGGMAPVGDCLYFAQTRRPPEGYIPFPPACVTWAGEIKWIAPDAPGGGKNSAGCIAADGMLYLYYENGVVALVKADPAKYTPVSTFTVAVSGKESRSHPAIANGELSLRDRDKLYCFNIKAGTR